MQLVNTIVSHNDITIDLVKIKEVTKMMIFVYKIKTMRMKVRSMMRIKKSLTTQNLKERDLMIIPNLRIVMIADTNQALNIAITTKIESIILD
jgi:hypothetical protein